MCIRSAFANYTKVKKEECDSCECEQREKKKKKKKSGGEKAGITLLLPGT